MKYQRRSKVKERRQTMTTDKYKYIIRRVVMLFLWSIAGNAFPLHAAIRISGIVTDSQTGEPMPYVSVYLQNTTDGCQTDKEGHFSFISAEDEGM